MLIGCQEILHYLHHIKEIWSELLQHDKTVMRRVDQATVKALELTAPWVSTLDAKILRGKVLGGNIFCSFSQQEREGIWARLQVIHDLIPSLFTFFEDFKYFDTCTDCLKWLICLGPRDTVSTAMKQIYSGANQVTNSASVQETEFTFTSVPAGFTDQKDLGYRQLRAFAMRYYREIPKKPTGKDLLAKPRATADTAKLREMADLAAQLGFESPEITTLKQYPKSEDSMIITGSNRPFLVTDGPGEAKKERYGMPRIQNYEEDRKYLFISHLHDDRDEQGEGITSFFRLRSIYLKFLGIPEPVNAVGTMINLDRPEHLVSVTGSLLSSAPHSAQSIYPPQQIQMQESNQIEDKTMQDDEEQRPSLQEQDTFTQETIMQEQQQKMLMSDANALKKQELEQEQQQQRLTFNASILEEQEQEQKQQQQRLILNANTLKNKEQEQEQQQKKLMSDADTLKKQELEQEQQHQRLTLNASILENKEQEQKKQQQKLISDTSMLKNKEQEQKDQQQKLISDTNTLKRQEQRQEQQRQKLISDASLLKEQEQRQEQQRQKLISDASLLKEQEQRQEQQQQKLLSDASSLREQEQLQKLAWDTIALKEQEEQQRMNIVLRSQEQEEREREELQRQSQAELADLELSSPQEFENLRDYNEQEMGETQADIFSIESVREHGTQVNVSAPVTVGQAQGNQVHKGQVYKDQVQESKVRKDQVRKPRIKQGHAQKNRHQGNQIQENQVQKDQVQVDQAQENKASSDQNQKNQAAKHRPEDENSDDDEVHRAHELQKGRKFVENNKYQRLNSYKRLNNATPIPKERRRMPPPQQRQRQRQQQQQQQKWDVQKQERATDDAAAASMKHTDASTEFTSDFTYTLPKAQSQ